MRKHLFYARGAPASSGVKPLQYESPANRRLFDEQPVDIELMVIFGVGDCRLQNLPDIARDAAMRKGQFCECGRGRLAADCLGDEVELARARPHSPHRRGSLGFGEPAFGGWLTHVSSFL